MLTRCASLLLSLLTLSALLPAPIPAAPPRMRVAAVQIDAIEGDPVRNRQRATGLVLEAAAAGARLVLLPEVTPSGYLLSTELWAAAEPGDGATVQWLQQLSHALGIWLGTTFIEADGPDFFNTFVLTDPAGTIAGRVRKQWLAGHETLLTRGEPNAHIIDTAIGTIGVAICYEATLCRAIRLLYDANVDLVLLPTADPVPEPYAEDAPEDWDHNLADTTRIFAAGLGVPAVLANQGGQWHTALPGRLPPQHSIYRGQSTIAAAGGTVLVTCDQQEAVIVADVCLDPTLKTTDPPECYGRYNKPMPPTSTLYQVLTGTIGTLWYGCSRARHDQACAISGTCE